MQPVSLDPEDHEAGQRREYRHDQQARCRLDADPDHGGGRELHVTKTQAVMAPHATISRPKQPAGGKEQAGFRDALRKLGLPGHNDLDQAAHGQRDHEAIGDDAVAGIDGAYSRQHTK